VLVISLCAFGQTVNGAGINSYGSASLHGSGTSVISVVVVSVPEDWSLSSSLGIFAFGLAVFGVARRFGLIKAVAF
jgi:hypothetical protein